MIGAPRWEYKRGKWRLLNNWPQTPRSAKASEQLKFWELVRRAKKVGMPVPERWMQYGGEPPVGTIAYMNTVMEALYLPAMSHLMNQESPLWRRLK